MRDESSLVAFQEFSCTYNADQPAALQGVNLSFKRGELVVLLGASGSGKSTLGLCMNGVIPHVQGLTRGEVRVAGIDVRRCTVADLATRVGIVFQDVESQLVNLYVKDEIAFGPENLGLPVDEVKDRVRRALDFVGLAGLEEKFVFDLSGGQKQKVALASVLAMEPDLIFLDEPTANLDPRSSNEVFHLISRLAQSRTVVVSENRVDEIVRLSNRLVVLNEGRIVCDGEPRAVLSESGDWIANELGAWIPQVSQIELLLRRRRVFVSPSFPLHIDEAIDPYRSLEFSADAVAATPPPVLPAEPVIRATNVRYVYGDGTVAVKDVSIEVNRGEILAIVGPNGSGKTTLVKHFVGLFRPTAGSVEVFGRSTKGVTTRELARRIGYVFQYPEHQFVKDNVEDELAFGLRVQKVPEQQVALRIPSLIEAFGLAGLEKRHPFSLSGGEKRRLSVATMLVTRPDVLILDEPTYGQDKFNTQRLMDALFRSMQGEEMDYRPTLILVTHDMKLVARYATRVAVMRLGSKVYDGPVGALFEDETLIERANLEDPPVLSLGRQLRRQGAAVPPSVVTPEDFAAAVGQRVPAPLD